MAKSRCECRCGGIPNAGKRFISGHNARGRRKPRARKQCLFCRDWFRGTERVMRNRVFCGNDCRDEYRRQRVGKNHPDYDRVKTQCATCGTPIEVKPFDFQYRPDHYCSPECGRVGQIKKLKGRKRAKHWRKRTKQLYGNRCALCPFDLVVEVHHIKPRSEGGGNEDANLIPLCPNHHAMADAGIISAGDLLAVKAAARLAIEGGIAAQSSRVM
jgi:endogenous inhibitor of DNA gyrase (YacG/DUF329 family)